MEAKLKHLEFLQAAVARMSSNSFLFKGWSITIAGALFGFGVVDDHRGLVLIALLTTFLFWGLDGYYLWLERGFIKLYNAAASKAPDSTDFNMTIDKARAFPRWLQTCCRPHLSVFYGAIAVAEIIGIVTLGGHCGT